MAVSREGKWVAGQTRGVTNSERDLQVGGLMMHFARMRDYASVPAQMGTEVGILLV